MSRTVLLDIDGVLMGWPREAPIESGFAEWTPHERRFWRWTSQEQLDLICDVFSGPDDKIVWLTTWEVAELTDEGFGANQAFSNVLGWKHHDIIDRELMVDLYGYGGSLFWWKALVVKSLLEQEHPYVMADQVIWVDDDHRLYRKQVHQCLEAHEATDRFTIISPDPVWGRESIESFRLTTKEV